MKITRWYPSRVRLAKTEKTDHTRSSGTALGVNTGAASLESNRGVSVPGSNTQPSNQPALLESALPTWVHKDVKYGAVCHSVRETLAVARMSVRRGLVSQLGSRWNTMVTMQLPRRLGLTPSHSRETKTHVRKQPRAERLTALFMVAPSWNTPKVHQRTVDTPWLIHTTEQPSATIPKE